MARVVKLEAIYYVYVCKNLETSSPPSPPPHPLPQTDVYVWGFEVKKKLSWEI